ncbi:4-hydroxyproline epimerase [Rhizobium sp. S95]|uniref:4-hydroxyproline epimerase n=1 Tax=Ciceribacter sichuanensis TaxID=2949647 RepID=A0AAJ1F5P8_9HYPH|nr:MULTISPECIES: 4-hydroxyproline epimerase [unclassified Ciceribacter]MCM2396823.1 4-hydroxyproline epimerase [Ciceribacter sp. S95]MCM2401201.1 4-hydroxyproline epimerase [Ciceribacter sp. S153]MCO5958085.1 4-hydroxyproline epimerase [Ciceribacter sp. S101]
MRWKRTLQLLDVHAEGEIGKVAIGGVPKIPGDTIAEQLHWMNNDPKGQELRRMLVLEPRGAPIGSVNLLLPAKNPKADAGFIILQPDQAHASSGSNSICVTTALLESGIVEMQEPETVVMLDTAAGLVRATATCRDGRCERVKLTMVPSFVHELDVGIDTAQWGRITFDLSYGGIFYALVDVGQVGLTIEKGNARALVEAGMILKEQINRTIPVVHPEIPAISGVAYVMFRDVDPDGAVRTCTTMWPGRVDRSPCGTGNSANLATLYARGKVKVGDILKSRSIIGSEFEVGLDSVTEVAGRTAVIPTISGRGFTFGLHQVALDPFDPFPEGFALTDVWGPSAGSIG